MEFGLLLKGQLTIIFSLFSVINFIDLPHTFDLYNIIKSSPLLKIGDEKGIFLFLYLINLIAMVLILELLKVSCSTKHCESGQENVYYIQSCTYNNAILLFVNFISLYIYKALCKKTLDMLIFALISSTLFNITFLMGLVSLSGYFYVNFVFCNIFCFLYTYVSNFDILLTWFKHSLSGNRFYNYFK
ncbi:hypothetical protein NGRA_0418 [Nosema granulosis]|uniref:Uncharacterized protein n=1 Tax=Nosema granulosis TaxID=83296 RepID=A0A9P6H336_9MICR|nr:hypothetical protein NGRA_0418 [Nosema granulosis]